MEAVVPESNTFLVDSSSQRHIVDAWLLVGSRGLAASYPNFVQWRHTGFAADGLSAPVLAALLCVYLVPAAGLYLALTVGRSSQLSARTVPLRRLALLIVAVPPAFTLLGVLLLLMKITGADAAVWRGLCASVMIELRSEFKRRRIVYEQKLQSRRSCLLEFRGWPGIRLDNQDPHARYGVQRLSAPCQSR